MLCQCTANVWGLCGAPGDVDLQQGALVGGVFAELDLRLASAVRRAVLGAEYVDDAMANADAFTRTLHEFITEWCWGGVWSRPGLPRKTRSLLNLAMLTALNRPHEIKLHVRGALNNGVTRQEISEVFLQAGVYAGVPAAVDAFRSAKEVFDELDKKK